MFSIFFFTACQLGLTQGNPNYIYSQESSHEQEEQTPAEEIAAPPSKQVESTDTISEMLEENIENPDEFIVEEPPELSEDITYEDGIFDPMLAFDTPQPIEPEETDEEIETSPEENGSGESCFIEIELLCGPDGWVDRQLHLQTNTEDRFFWNSSCESDEQSWDYYLSEFFTFTLNHGEELTLSLCNDDQNCDNLSSKDLGIRVLSNDSELEDIQKASTWSFAYTCQ